MHIVAMCDMDFPLANKITNLLYGPGEYILPPLLTTAFSTASSV